jgi:hypothetical protein
MAKICLFRLIPGKLFEGKDVHSKPLVSIKSLILSYCITELPFFNGNATLYSL